MKYCSDKNTEETNNVIKIESIFNKSIFTEKSEEYNSISEGINSLKYLKNENFNFNHHKAVTDYSKIIFPLMKIEESFSNSKNKEEKFTNLSYNFEVEKVAKKIFKPEIVKKLNNLQEISKLEKISQKNPKIQKTISYPEPKNIFHSNQDFESSEENCYPKLKFVKVFKNCHFITKKKKITKIKKKKNSQINLSQFIQKRVFDHFSKGRLYFCSFCDEKFDRPSSLGGHTSKNHPNLSKDYKYRQMSLKNRSVERKRMDYFHGLD